MNYHLVILVHGLWGNTSHFDYIKSQLEILSKTSSDLANAGEKLVIYRTGSNEGYKTYDGIDICGKRVALEIENEIKLLNDLGHDNDSKVTKISVLGYSLGGLISRYAIGILLKKGYFDEIEPINFTSFCTPHVGVLTPGKGVAVKLFNWLVPFLLANSGKQMFLKDQASVINTNYESESDEESGSLSHDMSRSSSTRTTTTTIEKQPLLLLMANPQSIFYKALKRFKYKSLYANVVNDKRTCWWTAGISMINPFEVLDVNPNIKIDDDGCITFENGNKFELHFIKNYESIVIDANSPIKIIRNDLYLNGNSDVKPNFIGCDKFLKNDTTNEKGDENNCRGTPTPEEYAGNFFQRKFKWLLVVFNIAVYAPMWASWFILNNIIQRFQSGWRVLKESDAGGLLELYQLSIDEPTAIEGNMGKLLEKDEFEERNHDIEGKGKAMDNINLDKRPLLPKRLSRTYEGINKNFEENFYDQTEDLMESFWDAMTSKKLDEQNLLFEAGSISSKDHIYKQENENNEEGNYGLRLRHISPSEDFEKTNTLEKGTEIGTEIGTEDKHKHSILVTTINELCDFDFTNGRSNHQSTSTTTTTTTTAESLQNPNLNVSSENNALDASIFLKQFELQLSKEQIEIVHNLNILQWKKFPIYIKKTNSTHAASIVRHNDLNFVEGETVVKHWLYQVFKLN
ncbi:hypothetical protein PACTADRAFT_1669 [Pachysolen tannophilus NRRL Y-2460]|uniref:DUF676 domain-containing protein n=1 Tax=Pachysolen tannophilus NRRL Y-2460 TaxID=669874 RepID=A0A1E4TZC7_PACTA|nr:hypothetical protein PACTADRAFT_1669 [Pachysolen tannophilus NRRL Y-2460]